jgi:23S rRNA (cytidine1920-2'-O)/16S rRNA (cytidine1409-2'-O)-methyltransferase
LDWRLRTDPRVVSMERTNIRTLDALPEMADFAVADVSFISLRLALPTISRLTRPGAPIVTLVKPQFEAGKGLVPRGGVVRDPALHRRVLLDLWAWALAHGLTPQGLTPSPIRGPAGNIEFLLWLANEPASVTAPTDLAAATAAESAEARVAAALASVPAR